jgi:hypothetical protein
MIRKIKEHYLQKRLLKDLKNLPDSKTPNTAKIHSVGILTTNELSYAYNLVQKINEALPTVRNVHIYSYREFKKSNETSYQHFSSEAINWKGKITDASFESFVENPFDLLIGYFNEKQLYLELTALKSEAAFKIGFPGVNDQIFDLLIHENPSKVDSFNVEACKYLTLLGKI